MPDQGKEKPRLRRRRTAETLRNVDPKFRKGLATQVSAVTEAVKAQVKTTGAAPVRVKLLPEASAKSHRPDDLFSEKTCPIVGAGKLGELFVKATPDGLKALEQRILNGTSELVVKEISSVETIEAITPAFVRGVAALDLLRNSPRTKNGFRTRVRLFSLGPDPDQTKLVVNFRARVQGARHRARTWRVLAREHGLRRRVQERRRRRGTLRWSRCAQSRACR
ncbi:MAG: hypothetical protein IPL06_19575 [Betaproteobacteria bacterium]|nr:hypothetical protein [Betaproteobacteria bacterium]